MQSPNFTKIKKEYILVSPKKYAPDPESSVFSVSLVLISTKNSRNTF